MHSVPVTLRWLRAPGIKTLIMDFVGKLLFDEYLKHTVVLVERNVCVCVCACRKDTVVTWAPQGFACSSV